MKKQLPVYNDEDSRSQYLELHDHRTLWKIKVDIDWLDYGELVNNYLHFIESHYKNLTIYQAGRSGRHICIDDTPENRKRYYAIQKRTLKAENDLIDYINSNF